MKFGSSLRLFSILIKIKNPNAIILCLVEFGRVKIFALTYTKLLTHHLLFLKLLVDIKLY